MMDAWSEGTRKIDTAARIALLLENFKNGENEGSFRREATSGQFCLDVDVETVVFVAIDVELLGIGVVLELDRFDGLMSAITSAKSVHAFVALLAVGTTFALSALDDGATIATFAANEETSEVGVLGTFR